MEFVASSDMVSNAIKSDFHYSNMATSDHFVNNCPLVDILKIEKKCFESCVFTRNGEKGDQNLFHSSTIAAGDHFVKNNFHQIKIA